MQIEPTYRPTDFIDVGNDCFGRTLPYIAGNSICDRKPPAYKLVQDYTLEGLEMKVNLLLADGWQLHGSLATTAEGKYRDRAKYTQAMVKNTLGSY